VLLNRGFKARLMVAGPTAMPPEVASAGCLPMQDERTSEFSKMFSRLLAGIQRIMHTRNELILFTSSGTGAMESCVQNLFSPNDTVIVATNGFFGDGWVRMCRAYRLDVRQVRSAWGNTLDMDGIARAVDQTPEARALLAVHVETSTGIVNDLRLLSSKVGSIAKVIDVMGSAGACEVKVDEWGIDVAVGCGHKALMTPPGVAFVSVSEKAWDLCSGARHARFYFDWAMARESARREVGPTPWTPAIAQLVQLSLAVSRIETEGLAAVVSRHGMLADCAREGMEALGLRVIGTPGVPSSVTVAEVPAYLNADLIVEDMYRDFGMQVTGGQDALRGRVIRLGHCGYCDGLDILAAIGALEICLLRRGVPVELGAGTAASLRVIAATVGAPDMEHLRSEPAPEATGDRALTGNARERVRSVRFENC
jgi:aspartate aminotransferase-like enzyme